MAMTLNEWCRMTGHKAVNVNGCMGVPSLDKSLYELLDYTVSSIAKGTTWLVPVNTIGHLANVPIQKYAVVRVSDDGGKNWLDFSTIRDKSDLDIAEVLVRHRGGHYGHRIADYKIVNADGTEIISSLVEWPLKIGAVEFNLGDVLEVLRLDDEEDREAGWQEMRTIRSRDDAMTAYERCMRIWESDAKRNWRVVTSAPDWTVKMVQPTLNSYRISGILWQADPLKLARKGPVPTDAYDHQAALIVDGGTEWNTRVVPVLDSLNAPQSLREQLYCIIAQMV